MTRPLPVLFVVPDLAVGGAERHLVSLVSTLDRARVSPSVVCVGEAGALFPQLAAAGVPARALQRRKRAALLAALDLLRLLRRERPGLVVTRGYSADVLARTVALLLGIPASTWVHDSRDHVPRALARRLFDRLANRHSAGVLGLVEAQRPYFARLGWRDDQVCIVPPGVASAPATTPSMTVRGCLGFAPDTEVVVLVARLTHQKDHATALRAFARVRAARARARLLLVGDGPLREDLERLAVELGVSEDVVLTGTRSDIADLLGAADVGLLSSREECAPQALLEAMSSGLPVVATAVGGVPEMVDHGSTGLLVPAGDVGALADALLTVLDDPVRRRELGRAGQRHVARHVDLEVSTRRAENALTRLARPPVRLTLVLDEVDRGGAETVLLALVRALDPARVAVRMICLRRGGELAADFRAAGCPVEVLGRPSRDPRTAAALVRRLYQDADVALVANHHRGAMALTRAAARITGTPDVVTVHTMGPNPPGGRCLPRHVVETLASTRALVVLSQGHERYLGAAEGVGSRPWRSAPVHVIPNGVTVPPPPGRHSPDAVREELGLGMDDVVIATVGRLVPEKDHDTLLRAFAKLAVDHPRARLVVVGAGPREGALRLLAAHLGVDDRVLLTGGRTDVVRLLPAFDVFALSSRTEAFPLAVVEAMHAGLPVVATNCGAVADLVTDGVNGHLVAVGDEAALADRLGGLLRDPAARTALGARSRDRAEAEFTDTAMAERYTRLVEGLVR
ncbi:glycosyltransferase [Actinomycetospora termitidis]|uniref:Glycosyltransferase n=1 Tax=Actinomycetospora termitidis TaxID=3053470 RepID=A0ABT7MI66_9PSEU|nr:glycosyltransferase [Actinomycetospora sp. Odt1-22]MDL5158998.1 glycosyltransferase [Actinomycetospora sp. Odt1-22]